jgi:regulatory protein
MARVTALKPTRGGRFAVHLDGEYAGSVTEATVARYRLYVDRVLSDEQAVTLRHDVALETALTDAYRLLAQRSRGRLELRRRLLAKDHPEDVVDTVIARLEAECLLDDASFAAAFVADKRRLAGWGRERIAAELRKLGVGRDIVQNALDDAGEDDDGELERALAMLERMGAPGRPLEAARRRAFDRLRRRGFNVAVSTAAVRGWLETAGAADTEEDS